MPVKLYQILYSINPRAPWPGLIALVLLALIVPIVMCLRPRANGQGVRGIKYFCSAIILVALPLHAAVLIAYLYYPAYLDHMEANVAAVSWLGWEGHPLYPTLHSGDIYGVPYGPVVYQAIGSTLRLLGPSVPASKALGIVAFALSQLLSVVALKRSGASIWEALTITSAQCAIQAGFTSQGYAGGVRSDALIFLAAQFAVLVAINGGGVASVIAIGLLGGLVTNLKIHGGLYVFPVFVYLISRAESTKLRLRLLGVAGIAGIAGLVLPFLPQNVSAWNYYTYFATYAHQPFQLWLFEKNMVFAAMLVAPLALIYGFCGRTLPPKFAVFLPTLAVSILLVTVPASANGAGPYHLLPFLPSVCWAFTRMRHEVVPGTRDYERSADRVAGCTLAVMIALIVGYGPITAISWDRSVEAFEHASPLREGVAEINNALQKNRGKTVSVGPGLASFDAQMLRVIPVFRGNPLPIDSSAWMTFQFVGVSDEWVRRKIRTCQIDIWLLPAGAPFRTRSFYDGSEIYSDGVRKEFYASYALKKSDRIFDQWECRHSSNGLPAAK